MLAVLRFTFRFLSRFLVSLLPNPCMLCLRTHESQWPLCDTCIASLPWMERACTRCGLPLASARTGDICGPCLIMSLPFDAVKSLFEYKWPCDKFIFQIKFKKKLELADLLGHLMASRLFLEGQARPACIIPVPLHLKRLQERGYNQAYILAKSVGKQLNIPVAWDLVKKVKHTQAQSTLSALGRVANLKNAYVVNPHFPEKFKSKVVIIDDVMTTGETVGALTKALKAAGVQIVEVWCCCRTPKPKVVVPSSLDLLKD